MNKKQLIFAWVMGVLLLSGCATISQRSDSRRATELYRAGNFEEAYNVIKSFYDSNPDAPGVKDTFERIKKALIDKYLNEANTISSDPFAKRIILQKALALGKQQDDISKKVAEVNKEIESINEKAKKALEEKDLLESFKQFLAIKNYGHGFDSIVELKNKIISNEAVLLEKIEELDRKGESNQALLLGLAAQKLLPNSQKLKNLTEKSLSEKGQKAFLMAKEYSGVKNNDRLATSLIYFLIAWNYQQNMPELIVKIKEQFTKICKEAYPNLIIEFSSNFSDQQKEEILTVLREYKDLCKIRDLNENINNYKYQSNDILVSLNLTDLSVDAKPAQSVQYSKFLSGHQTVPNAEYDQVRFQYEQAVTNARQAQYNYAVNPNWGTGLAKGIAEGVANGLAARVAQTPSYIQQPVYQDYQYGRVDFNYQLNLKVGYKIIEPLTKSILKEDLFENSDYKKETSIVGAHPQDSNGVINKEAMNSEAILKEFSHSSFINLSKFIVNDLVEKKEVFEAEVALKTNNYGQVVDRVFAYKLLKWIADNDLMKSEITGDKIGDISRNLNIININEVLDKFNPNEYLTLDLSLNNIFKSSFNNNSFLKEDLVGFKEAFDNFNPEKLEYKKEGAQSWGNWVSESIKKIHEDNKSTPLHNTPSQNVIDECLRSVVVIETSQGSGSGFIVNAKGYVITNYHVIANQDSITVKLNDGRKVFADLISLVKSKDLALLKINEKNIEVIRIGNINKTKVGDSVYALGAPGGWAEKQILEQSVTKGIVSSIRLLEAPYNPLERIQFIQTDAAINPGNSGGPLINEKGEVIGINNQKMAEVGIEGLNFAISIEEVKKSFAEYLN